MSALNRLPYTDLCILDWTFVCGSAMLSVSIGLNAVSSHGTCTAIFMVVAAITGFIFASIRTLGRISWLAWVGLVCIISSGMPFIYLNFLVRT